MAYQVQGLSEKVLQNSPGQVDTNLRRWCQSNRSFFQTNTQQGLFFKLMLGSLFLSKLPKWKHVQSNKKHLNALYWTAKRKQQQQQKEVRLLLTSGCLVALLAANYNKEKLSWYKRKCTHKKECSFDNHNFFLFHFADIMQLCITALSLLYLPVVPLTTHPDDFKVECSAFK